MHTIRKMSKPCVPMYTDWQMLWLYVLFWRWSCNDWVNQPSKLLNATVSLLFYPILDIRLDKIPARSFFAWTAVLDSLPGSLSMVLDSWCSEELHRTMLDWLLRDQSAVACRGGGANGASAPGIQDMGASKEWNYKNVNSVTRWFFLL